MAEEKMRSKVARRDGGESTFHWGRRTFKVGAFMKTRRRRVKGNWRKR